ncbi:MAG TPA: protein kinase [Vineibacter sp.]|nr:protein kinase [Vineibacter sp.]
MVGDIKPQTPPQHPGASNVVTRSDNLTALAPGTRVGKYEIVAILGQGGFGITYRAVDVQLDRQVAIKEYLPTSFAVRQADFSVLPRSTQVAEDFRWGRERFLAEARTLARLGDAPGVVDVFDYLEAYGTAYMVMALVRGETLEARLKREGRLPQLVVDQLLYPLLDGLEQVHEAGFLHRDIKPDNIVMDILGRPTLLDFGASRVALQGRFKALTAVYTPGYAALEQVASGEQGPWTDIYALAATLYHCITGRQPPSAIERMAGDIVMLPAAEAGKDRYTTGLLAAIDAGLSLKAADRPQSIEDLRRILAPSRRPAPPTALIRGMESTVKVDVQPRKRLSRLWLGAVVVAVCLAGAGAYVVFQPPIETPEEAARRAEQQRQHREEEARKTAEAKARAEKAEADRRTAEEARVKAAEEARRKAEAERLAAEETQRKAEQQRQAEEAAKRRADEERRRQEAERAKIEADRQAAEAARTKAAEEARRKSEQERQAAEAQRRAEEERKRIEAEQAAAADAKRKAEEEARVQAEREQAEREAGQRREQEAARRAAEEQARAQAEAKAKAEAEARQQAEATEAELRLSDVDRRRVKVALVALGFNTQGTDGVFGPRTRQMIAAWQKSQGYPESGYLTAPQLATLREQAPAPGRVDESPKPRESQPGPAGNTVAAARCRAINARAQIGEPLSDADLAFLRSNCRG